MQRDNVRRAGYDSFTRNDTQSTNYYDPDYSTYDPDYVDAPAPGKTTQVRQARPGQKLQINLIINNPTANKLTFELFNAFNASVDIFKPELVSAPYSRIPLLSYEGSILAAPKNGTTGFLQDGSLFIRGGAGDPVATIGCGEYPYKSLVDTTKVLGFHIVVMRVSVATQAQFDNNLTYKLKTYGGVDLNNTVNVRSYKRLINPAQLDIDVKAGVDISGESGLYYPLEIGERVQLGLYINKWAKPTI